MTIMQGVCTVATIAMQRRAASREAELREELRHAVQDYLDSDIEEERIALAELARVVWGDINKMRAIQA